MKHASARRLGACLVIGCAAVAQGVTAQGGRGGWDAVPDIGLDAETNDNPTLNAGIGGAPPLDATSRMLADVAVRLSRAEPRGELMFEPRVRRDVYLDDEASALESTDVFLRSGGLFRGQTVRVGYTSDIARERIIGVEFLETADPIGDDPSDVATSQIGANELRTRVGISPYIDIELNSRATVRLDGRIVDIDYKSGATAGRTDFLERVLGGEFRRELDQRGTLGVRVFATGYEAALNNNVTDTRGVELNYSRAVTELWSWNVGGGTQRSDFALTSGGRRIRGTDSTGTFGVGVRKLGEVSSMRADLRRQMSPDALGFVAPRDEVRLTWQRSFSPRINGRMVLRAIDAEGTPTVVDSERQYGRAEADVEWRFSSQWWFTAGYAYATTSRGSATVGDSDADSNSLTVGVRFRGRESQASSLVP
jgi:hypothetical protein